MEKFQPENESISAYLERIEMYFSANAVEEDKQVAVFLSVIGARPIRYCATSLHPRSEGGVPG